MNKIISSAVIAISALSASGFAAAQNNNNVTSRDQVQAEQAQLVRAGYSFAGNNTRYPNDMLAVEQKVASNGDTANSYGASSDGSSSSGFARGGVNSNWQSNTKP